MLNVKSGKIDFKTPKDYKVRPGTIDHGKEYEFKVAALLCLRCLERRTKHMWIAMNPEGCGAFDDVILCTQSDDDVITTYFMQLKHRDKEETLKPGDFRAARGDFSLKKYFADIQALKTPKQTKEKFVEYLQNPNQIFVLFTNKSAEDEDYLEKVDEDVLDLINVGGRTYRIVYSKLGCVLNAQKEGLVKDFFLFTNQLNVKTINEAIEDSLSGIFPRLHLPRKELTVLADKFILFVTEWSKGHLGGHYPLDQTGVLKKIFELLLEVYIMKLSESQSQGDGPQTTIWHDILKKTPVTLVDSDEAVMSFIKTYIGGIVNRRVDDVRKTCSSDPNLAMKSLMRDVNPSQPLRYGDVYEYLWKNENVPLVLQVNSWDQFANVVDALEMFSGIARVIVVNGSETKLAILDTKPWFAGLGDLSEKHQVKIASRWVTFQGRPVKLQELIEDQLFPLVTVRDIIHILLGIFNVGGEVNPLPQFFVERSFPKVFLEPEVLERVSREKFVIQCQSARDFQMFLEDQKLSVDSSDVCHHSNGFGEDFFGTSRIMITDSEVNYPKIEDGTVHYLVLHRTELEWVESSGDLTNIKKYRSKTKATSLPCNQVKDMLEDLGKKFPKVISSGPGMGKTVLMDYVALNAPVHLWLLVVNLSKHCEYFNREDFDHLSPLGHLQYFHQDISETPNVSRRIFERHLKTKSIFLLFDGYDEVPSSFQPQVIKMITSLHAASFNLCVTTRPGLKGDLERAFNTFAVDLKPFSKREQTGFLLAFFGVNLAEAKLPLVEAFVDRLLGAAERNFNAVDKEFMGVPLQTKLLGEVFVGECQNFLATNHFSCDRFDLLYLYRSFIKQKINVVCEKYGVFNKDVYTDYKNYRSLLALQLLFDHDDLRELQIDTLLECTLKVIPNSLQKLQKDGIVVAETKAAVSFTHRSFAEYLAAEWLVENIANEHRVVVQKLVRRLFDLNYAVVQNMFDRILADGYQLHSAIINGDHQTVEQIVKADQDQLDEVDRGGRTFLHLMAAWGSRHTSQLSGPSSKQLTRMFSHASPTDDRNCGLVKTEVASRKLTSSKDDVLGYTPLDYALVRTSFDLADVVCSKLEDVDGCISLGPNDMDKKLLDFYVNEFSYTSLGFVVAKHTIIADLTTTVHQYQETNGFSDVESLKAWIGGRSDLNGPDSNGYTALHIAAMLDHYTIMDLLVSSPRIQLDAKDQQGRSALLWAVARGNTKTSSLLLRNGADVNVTDVNGFGPLHYAVVATTSHQEDILKLLLAHGADPNAQDGNAKTVLHHAVHFNQTSTVALLLDYAASSKLNLEVKDKTGRTPLQWAVEKSNGAITKLLLAKGAYMDMTVTDIEDVIYKICKHDDQQAKHHFLLQWVKMMAKNQSNSEKQNQSPQPAPNDSYDLLAARSDAITTTLHLAVKNQDLGWVCDLLLQQVDLEAVDGKNRTPLHLAADQGHVGILLKLVAKGANLEAKDVESCTPLHAAAHAGHVAVVSELLSKGANLEAKQMENRTPLHSASIMGRPMVVAELVSRGAALEAKDDGGYTPLRYAVALGHLEVISLLLGEGADLEGRDGENRTPLHLAADVGTLEVVEELLGRGADVEALDDGKCTPLHVAARNGRVDVALRLIAKGAELDAEDVNGFTPLLFAVEEGRADVVSELLFHGADVANTDRESWTPLHCAARKGFTSIVAELADRGAALEARDNDDRTALYVAASMGHLNVVGELARRGADLDATGHRKRTALHLAAAMGHLGVATELISKGANLEARDDLDRTPLHLAVKMGRLELVAELVGRGADLEAKGEGLNTPLHLAADMGHLDIVVQLLSRGAEVDAVGDDDRTALHLAARKQHVDVVRELLTRGANPDVTDDVKWTPLHWAADLGYQPIVTELLLGGADMELEAFTKSTPLHLAAMKGHPEVVSELLSQGANVEATDDTTCTALHLAAATGHLDVVYLLISKGADLEKRAKGGRTPIHFAACMGFVDVVSELISAGADLEAVDDLRRTPLHFAGIVGHVDVVAKLLVRGADLEVRDVNGCTVLHLVLGSGRSDLVSLVLSWEADVNARDGQGCGALHVAVRRQLLNNVELVLSAGVDVNAKDLDGRTALFYAAQLGNVDMVSLLLSNGADMEENEIDYTTLYNAVCDD